MYLSPGSQQRGVAGSPAPLSGIGTRRLNHVEEKTVSFSHVEKNRSQS